MSEALDQEVNPVKRLYICGCISVDPDNYRANFAAADNALAEAGFVTLNPLNNGLDTSAQWVDHMKADIAMMLTADGVATIDGWEFGRGCRIEVALARDLYIPVKAVSQWVTA